MVPSRPIATPSRPRSIWDPSWSCKCATRSISVTTRRGSGSSPTGQPPSQPIFADTIRTVEHGTASQILGERYQLVEVLGSGGSATVWRGVDTRLRRPVAIKVLLPRFAADDSFQGRLEREARHIASLQAPQIVSVYDVGTSDLGPFIVMELVDGRSLRDHLTEMGPLPIEEVMRIGDDLLAGLEQAHGRGIIHRDLKPANVLLGSDGRAKITDFGISRSSTETTDVSALGLFSGTIAYSSPEQLAGVPIGFATDLYSLGCVLYECLCGVTPFGDGDSSQLAFQQRFADPLPVVSRRPDVPVGVSQAVMQALAKEPEARFVGATSMRAALRRASTGAGRDASQRPTVESPVNESQHEASHTRTRRIPRQTVLFVSIVGFVAIVAAVVAGILLLRATPTGSKASVLAAGSALHPGDFLASPNGHYRLVMQPNGALVTVVARTLEPTWSTGSGGHPGAYAALQNGNFVVRADSDTGAGDSTSGILYETKTSDHPQASLHLLNDGNLVLQDAPSTHTLWQSGSVPGVVGSSLEAGDGLHPLQYLRSPNGEFELTNDGRTGQLRLVSLTSPSCPLWSVPTRGIPASVAVLLSNGDFVLYGPVSRVSWSSRTAGNSNAQLVLSDEGTLTLVSTSGKALWQVPTASLPRSC